MANNKDLSLEDVNRLSLDPSAENKIITVNKLSSLYVQPNLTLRERKLAEDIFRIMVEDVEIKVRQILSDCLKNAKDIPHDVGTKY